MENKNWTYERNGSAYIVGERKPNGAIMKPVALFVDDESSARLFASAPRLLEALKEMCEMWRGVCGPQGWEPEHLCEYEKALAAIVAAEGEDSDGK